MVYDLTNPRDIARANIKHFDKLLKTSLNAQRCDSRDGRKTYR